MKRFPGSIYLSFVRFLQFLVTPPTIPPTTIPRTEQPIDQGKMTVQMSQQPTVSGVPQSTPVIDL